jgi:hypothetical protein
MPVPTATVVLKQAAYAAMMSLQKHTTCPVQYVTALDVHIKAGSGQIGLLPTFLLRTPQFGGPPMSVTWRGSMSGDHVGTGSVQAACNNRQMNHSTKKCTRDDSLSSSLNDSSGPCIKACHSPKAMLHQHHQPAPPEARSKGSPRPPEGKSTAHRHAVLSGEPAVQSLILFAWARIVVEMYLRDESVGNWSLEQLREHIFDDAICLDAQAVLDVCTDPVRGLRAQQICAVLSDLDPHTLSQVQHPSVYFAVIHTSTWMARHS